MKHLSKIIISSILSGVMCVGFSACGENAKGPDTDGTTTEQSGQANNADVKYLHTAVSGAAVVEQDGSWKFKYCQKCDVCGDVSTLEYRGCSAGSDFTSMFICRECGNNQRIEIVTKEY